MVNAKREKFVILSVEENLIPLLISDSVLNCSLCSLFVCGLHLAIKLKLLDWTILCSFLHTHYTSSIHSTSFHILTHVQH